MLPSDFDEANATMDTPKGMSPDIVEPLRVFKERFDNGCPFVLSCWRPTQEEMEEIKRTGRVWLLVMGTVMPPVKITGTNPMQKLV